MTIILRAAVEFVVLGVVTLLPVATVYLDVVVIGHGLADHSVTEYTQELLVLLTVAMLFYGARQQPQARGFLVLAGGFFTCVLIREFDELLNAVWHGFWVYLALLAAAATAIGALVWRDTVLAPMAAFVGTRAYYCILLGLLMILVFSRAFGSGNLLWSEIMGEDYHWVYRSAIQEGLELLGYIFIFYGACSLVRHLSRHGTD